MTIRPANSSDLASVKACAEQAYMLYVQRMGKKPAPMVADFDAQIASEQVYVIDVEGDLAGFIVLYPRQGHLHVENVAVLPSRQGLGLGRALLSFVETEAVRRGLQTIELYTNVKMTENLEFYPRLGYREVDRREEDGFSRVFFRKHLGPT